MDLSSLNEKQKQAVTAGLGPVLVLAGPGSGKTKTLTHRIAYIIEQKLVKPENILALTFTNKAAKEMRERVKTLVTRNSAEPNAEKAESKFPRPSALNSASFSALTMGTFHAVCAKILRHEITHLGYGNDFVIFDSDDQQKTIREILEQLRIDSKKMPPSLFGALISRAKNLLQLPNEADIGLESPMRERLAEVYARYQDGLYKQNALDFDDLLMLTVKIFENFPKVLEKYQKKFGYVLVDEYQDTNAAQYTLLRMLSIHHNVFVVGDDAQSIYKFRGSDITNILNFEKDYSESVVIKLEQNYRSTKNILDAAQKVIELNPEQKPKVLWTENPDGEKIILTCEDNERGEAEFVARTIVNLASVGAGLARPQSEARAAEAGPYNTSENVYNSDDAHKPKPFSILDRFIMAKRMQAQYSQSFGRGLLPQLPKKHESLREFCILYRTHAQSRAIEEVLIESSIPYQIVGGLKFYERREIKDMLAYLRLTLNFRDLVSLKRVINEPPRGIGDKSYEVIRDFILNLKNPSHDEVAVGAGLGRPQSSDKDSLSAAQKLTDFRTGFAEVKLQPKAWQSAQDFFSILQEFAELPEQFSLPELMKLIASKTGYEKYIRDGSPQGENRWENVLELRTVTQKFANLPWRQALQEFLEEVALLSEIDQKDEAKDAVTLMTLHSAKGLEFDNVFFVGLEEGILPHSRSLIDPSELSEEVRLAYVGLTRARKRLFLLYTQSRRIFGNTQLSQPSRILRVLPPDKVEFRGMAKDLLKKEDGELQYEKDGAEELDF